jgi:hypothetical protein
VPRYYFDILNGTDGVHDDEGIEFDSLDAAAHAATRSVAEVGTGRLVKCDISDVVIEVRDEPSQRVCTVTASMMVERHKPPSQDLHPWSVWSRSDHKSNRRG